MADLKFGQEELLEQAQGNQTAFWHLALRWSRERDRTVDGWASFVGEHFAPSWDEMGAAASALDVARNAARNVATTADMRPASLDGDEARAELVIEGPEQDWLDNFGTTVEDSDRANELIFRTIAQRRGLSVEARREGHRLTLVFAR